MIFETILEKLDRVLEIHKSLPEWTPLSKMYAKECGYKTIDGLRNYCLKHIHPDFFKKIEGKWYIHISVLHQVKRT